MQTRVSQPRLLGGLEPAVGTWLRSACAGAAPGTVCQAHEQPNTDTLVCRLPGNVVVEAVPKSMVAPLRLPGPGVAPTNLLAVTHRASRRPLFGPAGPRPEDVHGGRLGNCALLAVAAFAARRYGCHLQQALTPCAAGVEVHCFAATGATMQVVTERLLVTRWGGLPVGMRAPTATWPAVLEKARAMARGGYANLDAERPQDIIAWLWGCPATFETLRAATWERHTHELAAALARGDCVILHVAHRYDCHAYELLAATDGRLLARCPARGACGVTTRTFARHDVERGRLRHATVSDGLALRAPRG